MTEKNQNSDETTAEKETPEKTEKKEPTGPKYTGYDLDYFVASQDLLKAVRKMDETEYFLEDVSCLDMQEGFQLVYHFDRFHQPGRVVLRVIVSRDNPVVPSISSIYPGADWHERECYDFFGVQFQNHPNLIPLLLDPEFDGPPPLLKDESARKDLEQIYPYLTHTPVSVDSDDFLQAIRNCSKSKSRY